MKRRDSMKLCAAAMGVGAFNIAAADKHIMKQDTFEYYPIENETQLVCGTYCIVEMWFQDIIGELDKESFEADALCLDILNKANQAPGMDLIIEITPQLDSDQESASIDMQYDNSTLRTIYVHENKTITFIRKANV